MASTFQRILQIQSAFQRELLDKANVVGVGMGFKESNGVTTNQPAVVVLVEEKQPSAALNPADQIPPQINGVPTDVIETGKLVAQSTFNPRGRFRDNVPSGISMGHFKVTAGTLGTVVYDRRTGEKLLLSNNHVFANSNEAMLNDPILQPGIADGGRNPDDIVARLERFVALHYVEGDVTPPGPVKNPTPGGGSGGTPGSQPNGCSLLGLLTSLSELLGGGRTMRPSPQGGASSQTVAQAQAAGMATAPAPVAAVAQAVQDNTVDCALVRPLNPAMFSGQIANIGVIDGVKAPSIGLPVRKMGRTTGYTQGTIKLMNATVKVGYTTSKGPRTAQFVGQVLTDGMSEGGDSGSLIVDALETKAVGLLFAGSGKATIFTPINVVLDALDIRF
ncbi:MAG: hypothetical protein SF029_26415 [bacterium]|nr:hypothetical protein [bacterium]